MVIRTLTLVKGIMTLVMVEQTEVIRTLTLLIGIETLVMGILTHVMGTYTLVMRNDPGDRYTDTGDRFKKSK